MTRSRSSLMIFLLMILLATTTTTTTLAQLPLTNLGTPATIDFTDYAGSGFSPSPAAGQLDSDMWASTGMSDGDLGFGDTGTAGDFARGVSSGGVTTGGFYAFDVGGGDIAVGVQPSSADWTPGSITLKIVNQTGSLVNQLEVSYDLYIFNDADRSNSFNFAHSADHSSYTDVPSLDYTSPELADGSPSWTLVDSPSPSRTTNLYGVSIWPSGEYYLRWQGDDVGGSGSRDEFAMDNISVVGGQVSNARNWCLYP